ncbi:hypothetical protein [Erythrobacter sp. EC-HK427]|uniref:hypothetical protein n=1 Tax=Erythrobacter sp. EC-HK427 TaxID=2038396 RepID=UPI00125C3315|nr:hypothetical protein [Erythrobacter sp. EC-HK427]VVT12818.1 exported hypothetical protein [Erythrobacter sp. EC-HK427]
MIASTIRKAAAAATIATAMLLTATPAHASLNDQYQCDREGEGFLIVEIQALRHGTAILYDSPAPDADAVRVTLRGRDNAQGFRFAQGETVFEGWGLEGTLEYGGSYYICRMPIPNELVEEEPRTAPGIVLLNDWLWLMAPDVDDDSVLEFGASSAEASAALSPILGTPTVSEALAECPAGPLTFLNFDGLTLHFRDDALGGWSMEYGAQPPVSIRLLGGAQLGDTMDRLPEWMRPMPESTLGDEHYGAGVHALARDNSNRIGSLWAGMACVFR